MCGIFPVGFLIMGDLILEKMFDYRGNQISFKSENGYVYVNATEMAKVFGKRPNDYMSLSSTNELINAITRIHGNADFQPVVIIRGGLNPGTWMIEDVALDFAQWLSVDFKVWCNIHIKELLTTGSTSLNKEVILPESNVIGKVEDETRAKLCAIKFYFDNLKPSDASKQIMLESVYSPLGIALPDYVPSKGVKHSATELLKRNNVNISTSDFNLKLQDLGFLKRNTRASTSSSTGFKNFWTITDKGLPYGENEVCRKNSKETQPLWFDEKFVELLEEVGLR